MFKQLIDAKTRDIGALSVRRLLPAVRQRSVGPFVFFDHMGPVELGPGEAMAVGPHPHINLATVTYLFAGQVVHRDSIGSRQAILPGDINLMTAGRGIAHSERSPAESIQSVRALHGLQLWCALAPADEECAPSFVHYPAKDLPTVLVQGCRARVLIGSAWGARSPVVTSLPTFYAELLLPAGANLTFEQTEEECAAYVVRGAVRASGYELGSGTMGVFGDDSRPVLTSDRESLVMLIGGPPLTEPRHMEWNFISTRSERIEQAKEAWRNGTFPPVFDDDGALIPLPG